MFELEQLFGIEREHQVVANVEFDLERIGTQNDSRVPLRLELDEIRIFFYHRESKNVKKKIERSQNKQTKTQIRY